MKMAAIVAFAPLLLFGGCTSVAEMPVRDPDLVAITKGAFERTDKAYFNCVLPIAEKYAKNPTFLPDDIATAAIADCFPQMREHYGAYRSYAIAEHPGWPEGVVRSSEENYQRGSEIMVRKNIIAHVLRLRAAN